MFLTKKKSSFLIGFAICFLVCLCVLPSTSLAYTFYDFVDYCYILKDHQGATNDQKALANWVINNQTTIIDKLGSDIYLYSSWQCALKTGSQGFKRVMGFQGGQFNNWTSNYVLKNYDSMKSVLQYDYNSSWGSGGGTVVSPNNALIGLLDKSIASGVNFSGKLWNNILPSLDFSYMFSSKYSYNNVEVQAFQMTYRNSNTYIVSLLGLDDYDYIDIFLSGDFIEDSTRFNTSLSTNSNSDFSIVNISDYATLGYNTRKLNFNVPYIIKVIGYQSR